MKQEGFVNQLNLRGTPPLERLCPVLRGEDYKPASHSLTGRAEAGSGSLHGCGEGTWPPQDSKPERAGHGCQAAAVQLGQGELKGSSQGREGRAGLLAFLTIVLSSKGADLGSGHQPDPTKLLGAGDALSTLTSILRFLSTRETRAH